MAGSFNFGLGDFGAETGVGKGFGVDAYYKKGTPFMWLAQKVDTGFAFAIDPAVNARAALAAALAGQNYNVKVIFGQRGDALEVSGSQNLDRAKGFHIRDQVTNAARAAGFIFAPEGILFNVEQPNELWRVGSPGSDTTWGDRTPVAPVPLLDELGLSLPDLAGDSNFLGGTFKNLAIYAGLGLLAFFLITKATR